MKRLLGALLLLSGCWQTGRCFYKRRRDELSRMELLLELLEEAENEVIRLETPLPRILSRWEALEKLCSPAYAPSELSDFSQRWTHFAASLPVCAEVRESIEALGLSLSRNAAPEKAFSLARQKLERSRKELEKSCAERKRLAPALGACGGILLVLLLW